MYCIVLYCNISYYIILHYIILHYVYIYVYGIPLSNTTWLMFTSDPVPGMSQFS